MGYILTGKGKPMDFALTEEQVAMRETARKFALEVMRPVAAKYDASMEYPTDVLKKPTKLDCSMFPCPKKWAAWALVI